MRMLFFSMLITMLPACFTESVPGLTAPCWDSDGDTACDLSSEDTNGDMQCTVADCVSHIYCWDANANGLCDLSFEDINSDGTCTIADCQGPPGRPTYCWDLDDSGTCDLTPEDTNDDGACDVNDCQGFATHCWDLNEDNECDPSNEDINNDGSCDVDDCRTKEMNSTLYVKLLMQAKAGNGSWKTFVRGNTGQRCDDICGAIGTPNGSAVSCMAMWCQDHYAHRETPPHEDPYLGYGCGATGFPGCVPHCMCSLGGDQHSDLSLVLAAGSMFW